MTGGSRTSNSWRAERANTILYSPAKFSCPTEAILHSVQCLSWFARATARNDAVIEVFPKLSMSLEINEDGGILSSRIGHEINAFHRASTPGLSLFKTSRNYAKTQDVF